jgi:hypothetical protein
MRKKLPSVIPVKPAAIFLRHILLMMSTGSHRCIPVGNLTGSSGVTSAAVARRVASCFGTSKYRRATTMPLWTKYNTKPRKITWAAYQNMRGGWWDINE